MSQIEPNPHRLVDIRIVADYLDVAPDTVYTMVSSRRIPFVKVGRLLRFDLKAIDEWIKQKTIMPMPEKKGLDRW
jgi:excisionase family DNA binding protein